MKRLCNVVPWVLCMGLVVSPVAPARAAGGGAEPKPDAAGWYSLFDGKTLDGWRVGKNAGTFRVQDGVIVVNGPGPAHLFYEGPVQGHRFKNFHLRAEVMTFPKANSGIYFHTEYQESGWPARGYEAQVDNTHPDPKKTGGLYGVRDVMDHSPVKDNEWFTYDIIVRGKKITLKVNGKTTAEYTEPDPPRPPRAMPGRKLSPTGGTFALQGHDPGSKVYFRDIKVKPLPE